MKLLSAENVSKTFGNKDAAGRRFRGRFRVEEMALRAIDGE